MAFSSQRLLDLFQEAIRSLVEIFTDIAWNIFAGIFRWMINWLSRGDAIILETMIAGGLAIATYIYVRKFVSAG
jgi:hypothetical protein